MYIPEEFAERDPERIGALIAEYGFALLVSVDGAGAPFASHLPLLYDPARGPHGTLAGHMARANPQWQQLDPAREAMAVFGGPHAYVSPAWYKMHPAVPTWNYVAVHVYGRPRIVEDAAEARALLARMVETYEAGSARPWRMELPPDYEAMMIRNIVAFEIDVTRIEAKRKLSQNRAPADRRAVAERLDALGTDAAAALARMMRDQM